VPTHDYGFFKIQIRFKEKPHAKQRAHVHIYMGGEDKGSMFLDGTKRDGCDDIKGALFQIIADAVIADADTFQEEWDAGQAAE